MYLLNNNIAFLMGLARLVFFRKGPARFGISLCTHVITPLKYPLNSVIYSLIGTESTRTFTIFFIDKLSSFS